MMKKTLLMAALATFAVSSAYAAFPELEVQFPYAPEIVKADGLSTVRLKKVGYSDTQNLQAVENGPKAYLLNLETDDEIASTAVEVSGKGSFTQITLTFPALTANGEYQVVVPAGMLETVDGHETNPLYELKTFTMNDPALDAVQLVPVSQTPAPGTALNAVNRQSGEWSIAFEPEVQAQAGYMLVMIDDADPNHMYEGEPFHSQIQLNRREVLGTGEQLDMDLSEPFKWTWGGKDGSGVMYEGYTYKCVFEVRKSEYNEARDGKGELLGKYECTFVGNTMPEQYSDAKLVNITPTPADYDPQNPDGYIFEDTNDPHITFFFDKPVEPNIGLCGVNTGYGTSVPFEGTAVGSNDNKEWRFTVPKSQIQVPEVLLFFAFKDPETGLPVKGNSGRGANSTFVYSWNVEIGLPTLTAVDPEPGTQLEEISTIKLTNSANYYFREDTGSSETATLQTKQGQVVYTFDRNKVVFDNASDPKTVTLVADPAFTEPGAYELMVSKGYFTLSAGADVEQGSTTYQNKAFSCEYIIPEPQTPETFDAVVKSTDPENEATVNSLKSVEIFLELPAGEYAAQNYEFEGEAPVLKNEAGEQVATIDVEYGSADNSMKVIFKPEVKEDGVYTITFPAKYLMQDQSTNYTPEFTLTWTVQAGGQTEMAYDLVITSNPANNEAVASLGSFNFNFEKEVTLTSGNQMYTAVLMKEGAEVARTFMMPEWTNDQYSGAFTPAISEYGVYSITLPQDTFRSTDGLHANPETVFTWTVGTNGISVIRFVDGIAGDVYTLDGTLVVRQATAEDIEALAAGVYVIGGQKYVK